MVWINTLHINQPAPKGTCGGSICICPACVKERNKKSEPKKTKEELSQDQDQKQDQKCSNCRHFARGYWYPSGEPQLSGKCELLRKVLAIDNSSLVFNTLIVQDTFGCSLWTKKKE